MENPAGLYKTSTVILSILLVVFAALYFTGTTLDNTPTTEKAMLVPFVTEWGYNPYNEDEVLFNVIVYNYGYSEARNIYVKCELYEVTEEGALINTSPIVHSTQKISNLASTSYSKEQLSASGGNQLKEDSYYMSLCEIVSCDNCEILDDRIT